MNFTYADSKNITDIGNEIIDIANEYNVEITNLFKKLTTIPTEDRSWRGTKADKYVQIVALDKQQYLDFYDSLKEFASKLIATASSVDTCVRQSQAEEDYNNI